MFKNKYFCEHVCHSWLSKSHRAMMISSTGHYIPGGNLMIYSFAFFGREGVPRALNPCDPKDRFAKFLLDAF